MRSNNVGGKGRAGKTEEGVVRGGRVLHVTVQQPAGRTLAKHDGGAAGGLPVSNAFLTAFVRNLIREVHQGDLIHLALYSAAAETGASKEEVKVLLEVLRREQRENPRYPAGFMPEL